MNKEIRKIDIVIIVVALAFLMLIGLFHFDEKSEWISIIFISTGLVAVTTALGIRSIIKAGIMSWKSKLLLVLFALQIIFSLYAIFSGDLFLIQLQVVSVSMINLLESYLLPHKKDDSASKIFESDDYEALTYLFHRNGLEVTPGIKRPEHVIKCWECKDPAGRCLIGGASLEKRDGEYVVADLAVEKEYRNENIGTRLMEVVESEIIRLGGADAWLVGKVPAFYLKLGWEVVDREDAPDISNCFTCSRYGTECHPQVMHKSFAIQKP